MGCCVLLGGLSGEVEFTGVKFAVSPYKLSLIATPLFVKPGLPFFIKVSSQEQDGCTLQHKPHHAQALLSSLCITLCLNSQFPLTCTFFDSLL